MEITNIQKGGRAGRASLKEILTLALLTLILGGIFISLNFFERTTTGFAILEQENQTDFNQGTYEQTFYNSTAQAIQLNLTFTQGNYTSEIFDASSEAEWNNISWTQEVPYRKELPDNKASETKLGGADMTGNVFLLHMNEASGTIQDTSGEGNNCTQSGGVTYSVDGKLGTALSFDGSNDRLSCSNDPTLNLRYTITIEAWIKPDTTAPSHGHHSSIIDRGTSYWFFIANTGELGFLIFKGGEYDAVGTASTISSGTWTHVAITYDNSQPNEVKFYINGQLDKTENLNGPIDSSASTLLVGDRGNLHYLNGTIDEVAIYNRTLPDNEILNHYKRGALQLNLSARSCDDSACEGESFSDITDESPQDLNINNNTYFQYKFKFETDNINVTPKLYNVTVDYTIIGDTLPPIVSLVTPSNTSTWTSSSTVTFTYNVTDESNITNCSLVINSAIDQTNSTITKNTNQIFTKSLSNANYNWSVSCTDSANNIGSSETWQLTIDYQAPSNGGGGGGGGSRHKIITCIENWTCTTWGPCIDNTQARACEDENSCGTALDKPQTLQNCGVQTTKPEPGTCTSNWECEEWSECIEGLQTRSCKDTNECETEEDKPNTIAECVSVSGAGVFEALTGWITRRRNFERVFYPVVIIAFIVSVVLSSFFYNKFRKRLKK